MGLGPFRERLGRVNLYCDICEGTVASSLDEPRTPLIYQGECEYDTSTPAAISCDGAFCAA